MSPDCIGKGYGPVGTNGPTDTVESVLAEMRVEANLPTISAMHERTLSRLDAWADRLAAAHERDASALAASEARVKELELELSAARPLFSYRYFKAKAEAAEQSLSAMQARVDGLEVALRPLAELDLRPDGFDERPDTQTIYARDNSRITVGDVRRAIAAIAAQRQEKE